MVGADESTELWRSNLSVILNQCKSNLAYIDRGHGGGQHALLLL